MKAHVRSWVYAFLAGALTPPSGAEPVPAEMQEPPTELPAALRHGVNRVLAAARNNGELTSAYQRLFVGPARPRAYPYESCYRDPNRRLAGPWAQQVVTWYATENLAPAGPSADSGQRLLPDHITAELAFMAHLAARQAKAEDTCKEGMARQYRAQQTAFLRQHLLVWGPEFCRRLQAGADHPFYAALARLLTAWLELETEYFKPGGITEAPPAYPATVVARLCTLCAVCSEACPTQSLHVAWTSDEARLLLEPDGCTGCRLCAEVCPFEALKLGDEPMAGILVRSPLLPCPDCGRPALPEAFWQRVTRRLKPSDAVAVAARRCPACRESAVCGMAQDRATNDRSFLTQF